MSTADVLSRLPLQITLNDSQVPLPVDLFHLLNHLDQVIVMASQIKVWTNKDPLLSEFISCQKISTVWLEYYKPNS